MFIYSETSNAGIFLPSLTFQASCSAKVTKTPQQLVSPRRGHRKIQLLNSQVKIGAECTAPTLQAPNPQPTPAGTQYSRGGFYAECYSSLQMCAAATALFRDSQTPAFQGRDGIATYLAQS